MKTYFVSFALVAISLVSCKKETGAGVPAQIQTKREYSHVISGASKSAGISPVWPFNHPFSDYIKTPYINYLAAKGPGC